MVLSSLAITLASQCLTPGLARSKDDCSSTKAQSPVQGVQAAKSAGHEQGAAASEKANEAPVGNVPTVSEKRMGNRTFAVGSVMVNARAEKIWQILTDYKNAPDIFSNLQKCEVVEDKGQNKLVRQCVHPKGTPMKFDYIVEIKETAPTLMEWHRLSGALKEVQGSWQLEPENQDGQTKVTYSIYIDGGMLLPAWLLRGQSKNYLPDLLKSLKQASEHGNATAQKKAPISQT